MTALAGPARLAAMVVNSDTPLWYATRATRLVAPIRLPDVVIRFISAYRPLCR